MGASTTGVIVCTKCKVAGKPDDFTPEKRKTNGRASWCKQCHQAKTRQWVKENPEKHKLAYRKSNAKRKYGLTLEDYESRMDSATHCPICSIELTGRGVSAGGAVLDHCHDSNEVRDVICTHCNVMLGMSKDDPDTLRAAADYLELHRG